MMICLETEKFAEESDLCKHNELRNLNLAGHSDRHSTPKAQPNSDYHNRK